MVQKVEIDSCFVRSSDIPKSLNKWSKELNTEIDIKKYFILFLKGQMVSV